MHSFEQRGGDAQQQFEEVVRRMKRWSARRIWLPAVSVLVLLWIATGIYIVGPGEVGVVVQFGRQISVTQPGLNYRLPRPIQNHFLVDVRTVRSAEIGYRTVALRQGGRTTQRIPEESLMLTGDENIVEVQLFVQYIVQDPVSFVFRARDPEDTLAATAEVALRSVVGRNTIDKTMTEGREEVQAEVQENLQVLLDEYETGLLATQVRLLVVDAPDQVRNAFHDVVRAWEDRERLIKEAEGYEEDILPKARGEATELVQEAEAYRERRVLRAQGEAERFLSVLAEYQAAPDVTRERIYLETIEEIMPAAKTVILSDGGGNILPFLPLDNLTQLGGDGR